MLFTSLIFNFRTHVHPHRGGNKKGALNDSFSVPPALFNGCNTGYVRNNQILFLVTLVDPFWPLYTHFVMVGTAGALGAVSE